MVTFSILPVKRVCAPWPIPATTGVASSTPVAVIATEGWRRIPGLGRDDGVLVALQPGAMLALQGGALPAGPACLRVHVLPRYAAVPGEPWRAEVLAQGQSHPLVWPRGPQDAAWAQGVLANRLTASLTLPAHAGGPLALQLRAGQHDLAFDGAEALAGACRP